MPVAVIVDWYGPYKSFDRFQREACGMEDKMLYFGVSFPQDRPDDAVIEYLGLSTNPKARFKGYHKLKDPGIDAFYVGEITTKGLPGRRLGSGRFPDDLRAAEQALICAFRPTRNVQDKMSAPDDCVVVFSRFYGKNNPEKPKPTPPWFKSIVAYDSWSGQWVS